MEHFEDEDKTKYTYWKCQVKPISKVVSVQMTPEMGGGMISAYLIPFWVPKLL